MITSRSGGAAPGLCLRGGEIADVRAGVLRRASVAITDGRITAVGPDDQVCAGAREVIDVAGRVVAPGYIEPHTHALLANPAEFAGAMLARGTTTAVVDALPLMMLVRPDRLADTLERLAAPPVSLRWLIRLHPQSFAPDERFTLDALRTLWRLPSAAAVGEVTRWLDVHDGDPDLLEKIRAARADGKRVEGHAPGASLERLKVLADAGFTSDHEAMTAAEATNRLAAGLYVMLRHSSIRPDLPQLARAVTPELEASHKVMLTVDGPTPAFVADRGYQDHLIEVATQNGVTPMAALRMVTLNPAEYFGMADRGEVAAGKRADLNVLRSLSDPLPALVIAGGEVVARDGLLVQPLPAFSWDGIFEPVTLPRPDPALFAASRPRAGMRLLNDVITEAVSADEAPSNALRVVLIDRRGKWITHALLSGFVDRLGGLATTISSGFDEVVIGQSPADMVRAAARLADLGGGLVIVDGGTETFAMPLDLSGAYSSRPWAEVVEANRTFNALIRDRGYRFADPMFTLLFLTFDSLPWVRLTSRGVWDVRARRVIAPAEPLAGT